LDKIKILLVDDNLNIRQELNSVLCEHPNFEVVGQAENGLEAISRNKELNPDVILMDINMPEMNGLQAAKTILRTHPFSKILFLTIYNDEEYIIESYKIGAKGYILKDALASDLFAAIETVFDGEKYFRPTITKVLNQKLTSHID
jgi:DNA-binding NarL/FixJ family response regulator